MNNIQIDEELENLLPKLEVEKYNLLKADIIKNGCINPIIVWNGLIVDGHNRYRICKENNIEFKTKEMNFANKQEAMIWAWTTQKARRNVDDGTLFKIAEKFRPYYEQKAKEQQRLSQGRGIKKGFIECENLNCNDIECQKEKEEIKPINTTKELAEMAGTSQSTMNKVIQIQKHAPEPIKDAVESNVISINKGYELTKRVKDIPEEQKLSKAEELVEEQFKQECKELDKAHRIYCKFVDAVYKPISIEVTEENVNYWLQDKTQEEINFEEKNINDGIENLVKLREMIKKYKVIRVVK